MTRRERNFEALIYSENRPIVTQSCAAFAEMPLDWIALDDAELAKSFLAKEQFDLILLDLDSPKALSLLDHVTINRSRQGIVFAISANPADPSISQWCRESEVIYPVGPDEIGRYLAQQELLSSRQDEHDLANSPLGFFSFVTATGNKLLDRVGKLSLRQHSLSVIAQERLACAIAALGTIWFVNDITSNFRGFTEIHPYSLGSTQLIGLSLLLWLCAKQRRFLAPALPSLS